MKKHSNLRTWTMRFSFGTEPHSHYPISPLKSLRSKKLWQWKSKTSDLNLQEKWQPGTMKSCSPSWTHLLRNEYLQVQRRKDVQLRQRTANGRGGKVWDHWQRSPDQKPLCPNCCHSFVPIRSHSWIQVSQSCNPNFYIADNSFNFQVDPWLGGIDGSHGSPSSSRQSWPWVHHGQSGVDHTSLFRHPICGHWSTQQAWPSGIYRTGFIFDHINMAFNVAATLHSFSG